MAKNRKATKTGTSRRDILKGSALAAAAFAVPTVLTPRRTRAAVTLTVRDPGGPYVKAFGEGFYKPFNKLHAGEIEVIGVAGKHEPTSQVKAMVDTGSYTWDAAILSISAVNLLVAAGGMLEKLDLSSPDQTEIPDQFKSATTSMRRSAPTAAMSTRTRPARRRMAGRTFGISKASRAVGRSASIPSTLSKRR
jgi:putative spermidine/putrescine transport system substrate-binding protein